MEHAYINIAIIKYWGKKEFNPYLVPTTSNISILCNNLYSKTLISKSNEDLFYLNGQLQNDEECKKIFSFVDKVIENRKIKLKIESYNNVPTAAGLASSSSGYAALTKALNKFFNKNYSLEEMSKISTIGSGSAGRSFYNLCAFDSYGNIYPIKTDLNLAILAIIVSRDKKKISSRNAMELAKNSKIYNKWLKKAEIDFLNMKKFLKSNNFEKLGFLIEKNTMLMHSTTISSNPSFSFLKKESYEIIKKIRKIRKNHKINIFFTLDAGPNVKVIYQKNEEEKVLKLMKKYFDKEIVLC